MSSIARRGNPERQDSAGSIMTNDLGLLRIEDLHVQFDTSRGVVHAVEGVSYSIRPGEIVALVGDGSAVRCGVVDGARQ